MRMPSCRRSMILWGPPGVGKTTLARIIARKTKSEFIDFSAVTSGIKEIKQVMEQAEKSRRFGEKTILFVDEIHRFNKSQQDYLLPFVEDGTLVLIGATTENPYFEVNSALISRSIVFELKPLDKEAIVKTVKEVKAVIAVEEHSPFGGLGSMVAQAAAAECPKKVITMSLPDAPVIAGTSKEVFDYYGLNAEGIAKTAMGLI